MNMNKIDHSLAGILSVKEKATAIVRFRNLSQYAYIKRNFKVVKEYPFIRSAGIECDMADASRLSVLRDVEFVTAQSRVSTLVVDEKTDFSAIESIKDASCLSDKDGLDGRGVRLCVMDTGVTIHSDLCIPKDRIVAFVDMIDGKDYPYDDNGHGTFVAGVAVGNGTASGREVVGIAPKSEIVGLKVISASGESGTFKILDGMQWLFDNFRRYGIKVVCMSFGAEPAEYADPLKLGAEMLVRSGLTVVCAVGNSGENGVKSPAVSSEVISVGAVDENFERAEFSSRGTYNGVYRPDLYACGVKIKGLENGGTYGYMTGTSVSAPVIAGACCLLHQKYRNLTPYGAKRALLNSCRKVGENLVFP